MEKLTWEQIDSEHFRAKVFGGWLVKVLMDVTHDHSDRGMQAGWDWRPAMCFVPDPKYEWEIETIDWTKEKERIEKKNF